MPERQHETQRNRAIGIDLGITKSVMMWRVWSGGKIEVIESRENEDNVPSVVGLFRNEIIVGRPAVNNAASAPENTIFSIKRLMGRGFRDEEVQRFMKRMKYKIVQPADSTEDDVRVILGGKEYSPVDISAMILKKMKEDAELKFGTAVTHAVITAPAYFMSDQRKATALAGYKAGFNVIKILDEPTAAAIAFGVNNVLPDETRQILVYDLGGGTFDVSVLLIAGGAFAQLSVDGDLWLGGDDFDAKIMDYVLDNVQKDHGIDGRTNARFMVTLKLECEKAEIMLSSAKKAAIMVPGLLRDNINDFIDVYVEISRDQFNSMIADDIKKSMEIVKRAIATAKLTKDQIDSVLLVGELTNIPYVQEVLTEFFGKKKILRDINPMLCVAQGAAILARMSQIICPACLHENNIDAPVCKKCSCDLSSGLLSDDDNVYNVAPYDYGIALADGSFSVIIPQGTSLPTDPVTIQYYPSDEHLTRIDIPVFTRDKSGKLDRQGIVWVHLPPGTTASTPVFITFGLEKNGILKKAIVEIQGMKREEVDVDPGWSWQGKIERALKDLENQILERKRADLVTRADIEAIRSKIDEITTLAMENKEREANDKLEKLKDEVQDLGKSGIRYRDIEHATCICNVTEIALSSTYERLIDTDEHLKMSKMQEALRSAIASKDKKKMADLSAELEKKINNNSAIVVILHSIGLELALALADRPADQNLVRSKRMEVESAIAQNDSDKFYSRIKELFALINSIEIGPYLSEQERKISAGLALKNLNWSNDLSSGFSHPYEQERSDEMPD